MVKDFGKPLFTIRRKCKHKHNCDRLKSCLYLKLIPKYYMTMTMSLFSQDVNDYSAVNV